MPDIAKVERNILLSRFLTRSGDQAWSFAVPIILIQIFSGETRAAFIYFFAVLLGGAIFTPYVGKYIDSMPRPKIVKIGILAQAISLVFSLLIIFVISTLIDKSKGTINAPIVLSLSLLILSGLASQLGAAVMDISVANDIVPTVISEERIGPFNSRLRQLDLFTEVSSPVLAGLLLSLMPSGLHLLGFAIIGGWNICSFLPEFLLLKSVFRMHPKLTQEKITKKPQILSLFRKLTVGWPEFKKQSIAPAMICYSLLWLSALSPHGVMLTAFLKGGWKLPELIIGSFRALGAAFGLIATFLYPLLLKRRGLIPTGKIFISFQAIMVGTAWIAFHFDSFAIQMVFLICILFSRIGLYGFSLAEGQMRQLFIDEDVRGRVNGSAASLNNLATLTLLGLGTFLSDPNQFSFFVSFSFVAVLVSSIAFIFWSKSKNIGGMLNNAGSN